MVELQKRLQSLGLSTGEADGIYGKQTAAGVTEAQRLLAAAGYDVAQTGEADADTLKLLFDPEDMEVAIVCPESEVPGGQEVRINPRGLKSRNCFEFCSSMFLKKLRAVHGNLDENCSYRLTGRIIPELRAARFPMSTIQTIEGDEGADGNG